MGSAAKVLAWSTLGLTILFVILAMTAVFGWDAVGPETAGMLAWWGAVPLLAVALLLAVAVLVTAAFGSES